MELLVACYCWELMLAEQALALPSLERERKEVEAHSFLALHSVGLKQGQQSRDGNVSHAGGTGCPCSGELPYLWQQNSSTPSPAFLLEVKGIREHMYLPSSSIPVAS